MQLSRAAVAVDLELSLPIRLAAGDGIFDHAASLSGGLLPELGVAYFNNHRPDSRPSVIERVIARR